MIDFNKPAQTAYFSFS